MLMKLIHDLKNPIIGSWYIMDEMESDLTEQNKIENKIENIENKISPYKVKEDHKIMKVEIHSKVKNTKLELSQSMELIDNFR